VLPSVTTYCSVSTSVLSTVGQHTSESTPPATVNHVFEAVPRDVPRQSLRASPKRETAPGPLGAAPAAWAAGTPAVVAPAVSTSAAVATAAKGAAGGAGGGALGHGGLFHCSATVWRAGSAVDRFV